MDFSIIIVNWNSKEYLKRCIRSVLDSTQGIEYEIVVIDSGSFDGCGEMLKEHFPGVRFIQSKENVGFSRANNIAFRESTGGCLLFLNPDTEVVGPAIDVMFEFLQGQPNAGAVGCCLLNGDRTVQSSCIQPFPTIINQLLDSELLRRVWPKSALWGNAPLFDAQLGPRAVEVIAGACVMVKRTTFEQVGLFSEDYFMYAEDLDLCYKIRRAGYTNYYLPNATVVHFGGGSTEKGPNDFSAVMMRESVWRFMRKTRGRMYGLAYRAAILIAALGRLVLLTILVPLHLVRMGGAAWRAAVRKWTAILGWSVGLKAARS